ncbi:MAG: sigma-54-dependent Fis family transcriptional regulator [Deltaproteobacteria bacterium]|nr:sigma-54-dependent Fis family transcriptional regulator [Candidatus Anaeroferrophillus wilburensis]MBN2888463.1 sigma-54-dependent Fis family transcriptional regulator [Deltaproteobacteria bacterium]
MKKESKNTVLVVDDEEIICSCLVNVLEGSGFRASMAHDAEQAWEKLEQGQFDLILLDIMLPGIDGVTLLRRVSKRFPHLPVVMLSALDRSDVVVEAMQAGAWDYVKKPFDNSELLITIENVLAEKRLKDEREDLQARLPNRGLRKIISQSESMKRVKEVVEQIADTDVTVLIHGDTGVGKELVANRIHFLSKRASSPFVKINCAALPENLLESELFGFERGAFTGALRNKPGKFEQAGRGSIFLDEIGEMSLALQTKLLQVLQDRTCCRLGGTQEIPVRCRILVATNRNLEEEIGRGFFRSDLYYRLNVVNIYVPSLKNRVDDIPLLVDYFLKSYNERYGRKRKISYKVIDELMVYDWPGNVRELENWMRRFVILGSGSGWQQEEGGKKQSAELLLHDVSPTVNIDLLLAQSDRLPLRQVVNEMVAADERGYLLKMLERANFNKKKAAGMLQVSYKAFLYKLKACGLDKVKFKDT